MISSSGPEDFLELETRLIARIESAVPELDGAVTPLGDPGDLVQTARDVRVFLVPGQVSFESGGGRAVDVTQRWLVILSARNVSGMRSGEPARRLAGPLLSRLIAALAGWHPGAPFGLLRVVTPRMRPSWSGGVLIYPLEFETRFAVMAQIPLPRQEA